NLALVSDENTHGRQARSSFLRPVPAIHKAATVGENTTKAELDQLPADLADREVKHIKAFFLDEEKAVLEHPCKRQVFRVCSLSGFERQGGRGDKSIAIIDPRLIVPIYTANE